MKALHVPSKAERVHHFHEQTLHALQEIVQAAGLHHPGEITAHHIVRRVNDNEVRLLANLVPQVLVGSLLRDDISDTHNVFRMYWPRASEQQFALLPTQAGGFLRRNSEAANLPA
jgi:hypothetical protein